MSEALVGEFFELVDPPSGSTDQPIDDSLLDSSDASDQETGNKAKTGKTKGKDKLKVKGSPEPSEAMEVDDNDGLVEPPMVQEERAPVKRTPNLEPFKDLFLDSLAELLEGFEQFALTEASTDKELVWSVGHRDRSFKKVEEVTLPAYYKMISNVFRDRNISFREGPAKEPAAKPLDPTVGAKVAQKASVARPANTHECMCANLHRMIFTCRLAAADHPMLCQAVVDSRRTLEGSAESIKLPKADSSNVGTIPKKPKQSDTTSKLSESTKGEVKSDSNSAEASKPKRKRKRPDRSQSRNRSRGSSKDKDSKPSEPKKPGKRKRTGKPKKPPMNVSSGSGSSGKTDSSTGRGSQSDVPKPAEHGDKVVYRNGKIDWRYAPLTPTDLPPDRTFSTDVRNGFWHCSVSKK
jgi:hypothetical protein